MVVRFLPQTPFGSQWGSPQQTRPNLMPMRFTVRLLVLVPVIRHLVLLSHPLLSSPILSSPLLSPFLSSHLFSLLPSPPLSDA